MAGFGGIWDSRAVYKAIGVEHGDHIPPEMNKVIVYGGHPLMVIPSGPNARTGARRGHRILVVCACGKRVPFGRMPQHLDARIHDADRATLFPSETPESKVIDDRVPANQAALGPGVTPADAMKNLRDARAWMVRESEVARIERETPPRDATEADGISGRES